MYYVLTQRERLLEFFPKGAVGAEIGVADGAYSTAILDTAQPSELHLIDPWSHLEPGSDLLQAAELLTEVGKTQARGEQFAAPPANSEGDKQYATIVARFEGDPRVRLYRQYSYKVAPGLADAFFDFVYLDGNHNYEFVLRDLQDFAPKLKPGGLLFGHDFFENAFAQEQHYGVIEAVNTFLKRSDFRFLMLTSELYSTFCLARDLDGFAGALLRNLFESDVEIIELPDAFASSYRDKAYRQQNGSLRRVPSFTNSSDLSLT